MSKATTTETNEKQLQRLWESPCQASARSGKDYDRIYKIDRIRDWQAGESTLKLSNAVASPNLRFRSRNNCFRLGHSGLVTISSAQSTRLLVVHQTKAMLTSMILSIL